MIPVRAHAIINFEYKYCCINMYVAQVNCNVIKTPLSTCCPVFTQSYIPLPSGHGCQEVFRYLPAGHKYSGESRRGTLYTMGTFTPWSGPEGLLH